MTARGTEELIANLTAAVKPVKPLASPMARAIATLAGFMLMGVVALLWQGTTDPLAMRGPGAEWQAGIELAAALLTGVLATVAAFHQAIPGRSRAWAVATLPAGAFWLGVSGLGCWRDLVRNGPAGWEAGHSMDCLVFIMLFSLAGGVPLAWRLSRAAPVAPVPVAALGGLGIAALSAFLLQFFHPFTVTFIDLAFHLVAISTVMIVAVLFRRPMLKPA